jgi:Zn-dependent peptidase ImmA (M78 family)
VPSDARIDAFVGCFDSSKAVVLNSKLSNDRIRLDAMHELAHFLYDDGPSLPPAEVEIRAFEFASHMLLPESQLQEAFKWKSMVRLLEYKQRFGISLAAMIFRARKSKIISQRLYQRIWSEFSKLGYRKNEPGRVAYDRPIRMEALIDGAVNNGRTSYEELAKITRKEPIEIERKVMGAMNMQTADSSADEPVTNVLEFGKFKDKLSE